MSEWKLHFNIYLSNHKVEGTVIGPGDEAVNKKTIDKTPSSLMEFAFSQGDADNT